MKGGVPALANVTMVGEVELAEVGQGRKMACPFIGEHAVACRS